MMTLLAIAAVAAIGLWIVVVLPAIWLSGTISQAEEHDLGPTTEEDHTP